MRTILWLLMVVEKCTNCQPRTSLLGDLHSDGSTSSRCEQIYSLVTHICTSFFAMLCPSQVNHITEAHWNKAYVTECVGAVMYLSAVALFLVSL